MKPIAFLCLLFCSCSASKLLPDEQALLPQSGQWWLVNAITKNSSGQYQHSCALLSIENIDRQEYRTAYTALWRQDGTSYWQGIQQAVVPPVTYMPGFPISIRIPAADSAQPAAYWQWWRNRIQLDALLKNKNNPAALPQAASWQFAFARQEPFKLYTMGSRQQVSTTGPLATDAVYTGPHAGTGRGHIWVHIVDDKELLRKQAAVPPAVCLNLALADGRLLSVLFRGGRQPPEITAEACMVWDPVKATNNSLPATLQPVISPYSGPYGLYYRLQVPAENIDCLVSPRTWQQEITTGHQPFWMGAMEVQSPDRSRQLGAGNMYVFGY